MSRAASRLVNVAIGQAPPSGSSASAQLDSAPDGPSWETNSVRRAHEGLLSADLAALDHMRALAALLRSKVSINVTTATVTRGCVEAFSRVHWLLAASSVAELVQRHVSLSLADIYFAGKLQPDEPLRTGAGAALSVADYEQRLRQRLAQYPDTPVLKVSRTRLASDLLDDAVSRGRVKYSQLSGIAHGDSIMVNAFIDLDSPQMSKTREMALHLPRTHAIEFTGYALVACARQHNLIAEQFGIPPADRDRWTAARDRAMYRFRAVDLRYRKGATDEAANSDATER